MIDASQRAVRCGIVLAGGEGRRLEPFVRRLLGKPLPKQYVSFMGTRSMLENTFHRVERLIPRQRLYTVVGRNHLQYPEVRGQLSMCPQHTVVVQPEERETGPGILLPLMHVYRRYPDSTVAIFPSDHFIADEESFMAHVDKALSMVEHCPSSVVLMGVKPTDLESDYGYILPGKEVSHQGPWGMRRVLRFVEKPGAASVGQIILEGGLWNTFVMAFKIETMLELVSRAWPGLWDAFERIGRAIGSGQERDVVRRAYRKMEPVNFSRGLLETLPCQSDASLWVLPVHGVRWSDWGSEQRIVETLRDARYSAPVWRARKQHAREMEADRSPAAD